jgi:hypothetical protein
VVLVANLFGPFHANGPAETAHSEPRRTIRSLESPRTRRRSVPRHPLAGTPPVRYAAVMTKPLDQPTNRTRLRRRAACRVIASRCAALGIRPSRA